MAVVFILGTGENPLKKIYVVFAITFVLLLTACGQTQTYCEICGRNHRADFEAGLNGAPSQQAFFEVFSPDPFSEEFLRVYVESCWTGSIEPQHRLHFVAQYDTAGLYAAISIAESNMPFSVMLDGETIMLTTDILGLEKIFIILNERQREVGFAYDIRRGE